MAEGKTGDKIKKADTVLDAMDEVAADMEEMKLMKEEAKKANKEEINTAGQDGIHIVHTTNIIIVMANNVQLGNHNTMIINKEAKEGQENESSSSSEEEEEGEEEEEECNQEKPPEEMTPEERKCETLIHYLGLTDVDIDHLELDYKVEGVKEVLHQGLLKWMQSEHQTVGQLAQSLKKLGKEDAVEELCDTL